MKGAYLYFFLSRPVNAAGSRGFDLLSACGDDNNDFHACNLSFRWGGG